MRYDLDLIHQMCGEIGLSAHLDVGRCVEIEVGEGAVLCFRNAEQDKDCLIEFRGTPWHGHDDLIFTDRRGHHIRLDYLDLVTGLTDGRVLVCELQRHGQVVDRWLIHRDYNDEFSYMEADERIVVRRATTVSRG